MRPSPSPRTTSRVLTAVAVAAVTALVLGVLGPRPPSLADAPTDTGDAALATRVRELAGDGRGLRGLAVALVAADGSVRLAGVGSSGDPGRPQVDESTRFEIGSVTKALTGQLLAVGVERGDVALEDRVGDATLEDLATHRSGLPRLPAGAVLRGAFAGLSAGDPYTGGPRDVLAAGLAASPRSGADPAYSNLGAAVLGDVLAQRAGTSYGQLLAADVLEPLGMTSTTVVPEEDELPEPRARGATAAGRASDPWIAEGWAPAGIGTWSTSADLARLVAAVAAGTAPGQVATEPRADSERGERIGLLWRTLDVDGHDVVFHDGATGGSTAFVGVDRTTGRGVVVLSATGEGVDGLALELLTGEAP